MKNLNLMNNSMENIKNMDYLDQLQYLANEEYITEEEQAVLVVKYCIEMGINI